MRLSNYQALFGGPWAAILGRSGRREAASPRERPLQLKEPPERRQRRSGPPDPPRERGTRAQRIAPTLRSPASRPQRQSNAATRAIGTCGGVCHLQTQNTLI